MSDDNSDDDKIEKETMQLQEESPKTEPSASEGGTSLRQKKKREYVMTEARKAALERCKAARKKVGEESKAKKEQAKEMVKQILKGEDKPLAQQSESIDSQKAAAEEKVVVSQKPEKKKKKTKQVIVFESDSDSSEEENQIIIRRKRSKAKKEPEVIQEPQPQPIPRLRRL